MRDRAGDGPVRTGAGTPPPATLHHRLMILGAALLFSTGGAAIKACSLDAWQVASFRSGIAVLALLALMPAARRRWTPRVWAVGASYAATMLCYAVANKLTTAANTIFLQSTAPLYVMLLSPWLLGERIRRRDVLFMLVMAAGMALFFAGDQPVSSTAPEPMRGNLLATCAGVTWGLTIMGLRWLGRADGSQGSSTAAVACGNLIACCAVLPLALPVASARPVDWMLIAFLGVFQVAAAYILLTAGLARVNAFEGSLLLLIEPVFNPLWAWIVHRELATLWASIGGAVILGATTVKTWFDRRPRPPVSTGAAPGSTEHRPS